MKLRSVSFICFHHSTALVTRIPTRHLDEFLEICSTVTIQNFDDDALRLTLFPFFIEGQGQVLAKVLRFQ